MNVTLNTPEDLYDEARKIANSEGASVEQVISSALAEQMAAMKRLRAFAERGDRERFLRVLEKAPDVEPEAFDKL